MQQAIIWANVDLNLCRKLHFSYPTCHELFRFKAALALALVEMVRFHPTMSLVNLKK